MLNLHCSFQFLIVQYHFQQGLFCFIATVMGDSDFCAILNSTDNLSLVENESTYNFLMIFGPCFFSVLAQFIWVIFGFNVSKRNALSIFYNAFLATSWIFLACLVELNERNGFFLSSNHQVAANAMCKGLGFGQIITQMLAHVDYY